MDAKFADSSDRPSADTFHRLHSSKVVLNLDIEGLAIETCFENVLATSTFQQIAWVLDKARERHTKCNVFAAILKTKHPIGQIFLFICWHSGIQKSCQAPWETCREQECITITIRSHNGICTVVTSPFLLFHWIGRSRLQAVFALSTSLYRTIH